MMTAAIWGWRRKGGHLSDTRYVNHDDMA